ncbi:MAG TPA: S8 family peptidase [Vicinamibacterales bacterium]|jgi:serine protease AprX|nr:S8 family peptidase [Vicinamibacterales bacterium]
MQLRKLIVLGVVCAAAVAAATAPRSNHLRHRASVSDDLRAIEAGHSTKAVRVIAHGTESDVRTAAARHGVPVVRVLTDGVVLEATTAQLDALRNEPAVEHLSGDLPVADFMTVSRQATAATQVYAGKSGGLLGLGGISGVTGQGVVVAVLDSGIASHKALSGKVIASVSMIAGQPTTDEYGHGTHVAGIITGSGSYAAGVTSLYAGGIAPGAQLVNVRVLGDDGVGNTSDVIAGIDWVIANKSTYKIKVINLSLGHAVTEPVMYDPLCAAVERAYRAGIIVVAAAGNAGKLADGTPVLGGIASPGNSPYAITVGATNTWGTATRSDDTITTYSSRGPTKWDNNAKPDLAAPGNKIISLEAPGSYIATNYPSEHIAGSGNNGYLRMSGTSMSAPMISGAVALLLQAQPSMSATQAKFVLQTGSSYMVDAGVYGAGAGSANFWTSRQEQASAGLLNSVLGLLGLDQSGGMSFWDDGRLETNLYNGTGIRLLNLLELPGILLNPNQLAWGKLNLVGLTNTISVLSPKRILFGDVSYWTSSEHLVWGDDVYSPEGQHLVWGDNDTTDDYHLVWGDATTTADDAR